MPKALDALKALESRSSAATIKTMDLTLPPRPVPRRQRPFIAPKQIKVEPPAAPPANVVLDGFVLLEACRVEDPDEAEKAVLEGCGISSVVSEDLSFFRKLTHLDLGDNHVALASLAYLPALVELHLDCNGLQECSCPAGGFPMLEVLNLSYNGLSTAAIAGLADMPRLRQLDLSCNELTALPADMSGFGTLQSLNCEHNLLGTEATFLALATIPMLRSLSLAHNRVEALVPTAAETAYAMLTTLDLAHNLISREEALLPVLQMGSLRTLLLYGNPFLKHGSASEDFHEVLAGQRGVELITLPPPPPQPPAKIDLSSMTTVSDPPSRQRPSGAKLAAAKPPPRPASESTSKPAAADRRQDDEPAGPSFFLTEAGNLADGEEEGGEGADEMDEAMLAAQAAALDTDFWSEADALFDQAIDLRTATHALKAALARPSYRPADANASHLRLTANLRRRQRDKARAPLGGAPGTQKAAAVPKRPLANGMAPPERLGGPAENMGAALAELQQRMGAHHAAAAPVGRGARRTNDVEGDACVSSLNSMMHAMGEMSVGAGAGAVPAQPSVA